MTETDLPLIDDPAAPWNRATVSSAFAQSELGLTLSLYRDDRGWMTYDELYQLVCDEAASVPAEEAGWRDGEFNAHEYIIEACLVGLYDTINVDATHRHRVHRRQVPLERRRSTHADLPLARF